MLNSNGIPAGDPTGWYVDKHGMVRYEPDLAVKRRLCLDNLCLLGWAHRDAGERVPAWAVKRRHVMNKVLGDVSVPDPPVELKREYTI